MWCGGLVNETNRLGKPVTARVTVRIPASMVTETKARAGRAGLSVTEILNAALARYLTTQK
jgi:predicted DNA binding CopG/RHH family protein